MRSSWFLIMTMAAGFLFLGGCSDDGTGPGPDSGGDVSTTDGPAGDVPVADTAQGEAAAADGPVMKDSAITFAREVTLGYDDGLPEMQLTADPSTRGLLLVKPDSKLLPVEVRKIKFIPASTYSAKLIVAPDVNGSPGNPLLTRNISIVASDVDKWKTIDLSASKVLAQGNFWVTLEYPSTLTSQQKMLYGGTSSSGHNLYFKSGYPIYTTNFDMIMRVTVGTPDKGTSTKGKDGAACKAAVDCQSGYCSGGKCTVECSSGSACGASRICRAFKLGKKICVTKCTQKSNCPAGSFCLTDTTYLTPAGFCIKGGPLAANQSCQYHYHTICATGHCSACDKDPTKCDDPGTCK